MLMATTGTTTTGAMLLELKEHASIFRVPADRYLLNALIEGNASYSMNLPSRVGISLVLG